MNIDNINTTPGDTTVTATELAASVLAQVGADPTIEPHIRNALLGTAADLLEHGKEYAAAEVVVACMFDRMGCAVIK